MGRRSCKGGSDGNRETWGDTTVTQRRILKKGNELCERLER